MLLISSLFASIFLVIFINVALVLLADKYEIKFKYYKSAAVSMSVIVVSVIISYSEYSHSPEKHKTKGKLYYALICTS